MQATGDDQREYRPLQSGHDLACQRAHRLLPPNFFDVAQQPRRDSSLAPACGGRLTSTLEKPWRRCRSGERAARLALEEGDDFADNEEDHVRVRVRSSG